jgi:hypothetical protein
MLNFTLIILKAYDMNILRIDMRIKTEWKKTHVIALGAADSLLQERI